VDDPHVTVRISDVSVSSKSTRILDGVSFDCLEGEWTVIHGPSGAGKSTLLRAINGLCPLTGGYIDVLSTQIPGRSRRDARTAWTQTGTVLQEVALFETKTALENVVLALHAVGLDRRSVRDRAREWLEHLDLGDKLDEYPSRLSGGQRQRVALARAFATRPRLLLLDEPTSALDSATARIVLTAVKKLVKQGATVVMSSHRTDEVAGMCDQQVGLRDGRLWAIESPRTAGERVEGVTGTQPDIPVAAPFSPRRRRRSILSLIWRSSDRNAIGTEAHDNESLSEIEGVFKNPTSPNLQESTGIPRGTDRD
jgi:ABC-type multidrug transport system ATPase subunit